MAIMELIGYAFSWFVAISILIGPDPEASWIVVGLIFLLEHPIDAALTHAVAIPRTGQNETFNRYANGVRAHADGVGVKQPNRSLLAVRGIKRA
jgi:hypothetical protein